MAVQPAATVYRLTNQVNGKTYVGVTGRSVEQRWLGHIYDSTRSPKSWLHRSIRKYGAENFIVEPIASCFSIEAGKAAEKELIRTLAPIYNQTNGGELTRGRHRSAEVSARIAAKNRGLKRTPEQIARNSAQAKARWARDPKYRELALAASRKGFAKVDETKRRLAVGNAARGRMWSQQSRLKLSESCKTKYSDPQARLITALSQIGRKFSAESRAKMSASAKRRKSTQQTREQKG